jgi:flagellum-specific peptidoglycan hydrolase FlgJ
MMDRYKPCRKCNKDYECWARQLKKCGYATSKTYTESLIAIIERNKLYEYDNWN